MVHWRKFGWPALYHVLPLSYTDIVKTPKRLRVKLTEPRFADAEFASLLPDLEPEAVGVAGSIPAWDATNVAKGATFQEIVRTPNGGTKGLLALVEDVTTDEMTEDHVIEEISRKKKLLLFYISNLLFLTRSPISQNGLDNKTAYHNLLFLSISPEKKARVRFHVKKKSTFSSHYCIVKIRKLQQQLFFSAFPCPFKQLNYWKFFALGQFQPVCWFNRAASTAFGSSSFTVLS